jgi:hypothetical protein
MHVQHHLYDELQLLSKSGVLSRPWTASRPVDFGADFQKLCQDTRSVISSALELGRMFPKLKAALEARRDAAPTPSFVKEIYQNCVSSFVYA